MAKQFTSSDAKQLLRKHTELRNTLKVIAMSVKKHKGNASSIAQSLLSRNKFSDYYRRQLLSGDVNVPIPEDFSQLIHSLCKYIIELPLSEEGGRLFNNTQVEIANAMAELKPASNSVQWLFTSKKNKSLAVEAYSYLKEAMAGSYYWQIQSLSKDINQSEHQSVDVSITDYEQQKRSYRDALYSIAPTLNTDSHNYAIPEVEQLCQNHQTLISQIEAAQSSIEKGKSRIKDAAERVLATEILKMLKGIPIEELGRERSGIRVKTLRDHGYESICDVYCATIHNLTSVNGISESAAYTVKAIANQYANQAKSTGKIKLSVDSKTPETTRLIAEIYDYRQRTAAREALEELKRNVMPSIHYRLGILQSANNAVEWFFSELGEREQVIDSFQLLKSKLIGEYPVNIHELSSKLSAPIHVEASTAWDDFERSSIAYFNVIEDIIPGILGNDDSLYGLPEELAREIQDECFFPDGLKCTLRRYQEWGVKYILHQGRVLLGDEMGLGKTIQAIATMVSLRNTGATHFLVVCPASVLPNWCKEITAKSKLRVTKIHGSDRLIAFSEWKKTGGAGVTTFETTGYLKFDKNEHFNLMIVDEAHYIKNDEARRSINVKRLGERAERLLFMTGTALENKVDEMISLLKPLQPLIASQLHNIAFMSSAPQFREKVAPVYYRRKRENVLTELPELTENKEWCALLPEEKRIYEHSVMLKRYADIRRVSWSVGDLTRSSKGVRMREIIEEAKDDERKVIVFSFYLETIRSIQRYLGNCCTDPINGSVPTQRRQEIIDAFDEAPAGTVLLAQIQSGGTGLNIQSASVVILCEPQLKPSIENQAISRAYRMGQARNVLVYRLLCENSIDERITEMLAHKQAIFDAFADRSTAAESTPLEEVELDEKTMGALVKEEIERINAERDAENK